jgi:carbon starvation protein
MERTNWLPGNIIATSIVVASWGYFLWTGNISTIWPMFGTANQLLAAVALSVTTSVLINSRKQRYAWVTMIPMVFVAVTTLTAAVLNITDTYWPMTGNPATAVQGYVNSALTIAMILCAVVVLVEAWRRWYAAIVLGHYEVKVPPRAHKHADPPIVGCC